MGVTEKVALSDLGALDGYAGLGWGMWLLRTPRTEALSGVQI